MTTFLRQAVGGLEIEGGGEFRFALDAAQKPIRAVGAAHLEVHDVVAELMILANHLVAVRLLAKMPDRALLRKHPAAAAKRFEEVVAIARKHGLDFDTSSNRAVRASMDALRAKLDAVTMAYVDNAVTRALSEAQYVCAGAGQGDFFHYGLGLEAYTHFTSPIRRYADLLVARLLLEEEEEEEPPLQEGPGVIETKIDPPEEDDFSWAEALEAHAEPVRATQTAPPAQLVPAQDEVAGAATHQSPRLLQAMCEHINEMHRAAKDASTRSQELFFALMFAEHPRVPVAAVVSSVRERSLTCYVGEYGLTGTVRLDDLATGVYGGGPLGARIEGEGEALVLWEGVERKRVIRALDRVTVALTCERAEARLARVPGVVMQLVWGGGVVPLPSAAPLATRVVSKTGGADDANKSAVRQRVWMSSRGTRSVLKGPGRRVFGDYVSAEKMSARQWLEDEVDEVTTAEGGLSASKATEAELKRAEREASARLSKLLSKKYDARVKQRKKKEG